MMPQPANHPHGRRGLSLLELLLAMSITAMVAAAITAMLGAVSAGVGTRRDSREAMVLANAAQSRLSAYIAPSRCVLAADKSDMVLWLNDARESDTVHGTEIRWLRYDPADKEILVSYVEFPAGWSQAACDLEDETHPMNSDWMAVLNSYRASGFLSTQTLIDNVSNVAISLDQDQPLNARFVLYRLEFEAEDASMPVIAAATIRQHGQPVK